LSAQVGKGFVFNSLKALALLAGATCVLAACAPVAQAPSADVAPESVVAQPTPEAEFVPEFFAKGSALENQPFVDYVVGQALDDSENKRAGAAVAQALQGAGINRELLELTPDTSLIELPVDSVTIAIRFGDDCVIGQWGTDWYVSQVEPVLATQKCLLGETVSLD